MDKLVTATRVTTWTNRVSRRSVRVASCPETDTDAAANDEARLNSLIGSAAFTTAKKGGWRRWMKRVQIGQPMNPNEVLAMAAKSIQRAAKRSSQTEVTDIGTESPSGCRRLTRKRSCAHDRDEPWSDEVKVDGRQYSIRLDRGLTYVLTWRL
jgi:hypothetical protein